MKSQSQRTAAAEETELVTSSVSWPLSGPSYGPFEVVKRRWHKPLPAIIADAIANNQALLARLERGVHCPDEEGKLYYTKCLTEVCKRTREQLAALETFNAVDWRE